MATAQAHHPAGGAATADAFDELDSLISGASARMRSGSGSSHAGGINPSVPTPFIAANTATVPTNGVFPTPPQHTPGTLASAYPTVAGNQTGPGNGVALGGGGQAPSSWGSGSIADVFGATAGPAPGGTGQAVVAGTQHPFQAGSSAGHDLAAAFGMTVGGQSNSAPSSTSSAVASTQQQVQQPQAPQGHHQQQGQQSQAQQAPQLRSLLAFQYAVGGSGDLALARPWDSALPPGGFGSLNPAAPATHPPQHQQQQHQHQQHHQHQQQAMVAPPHQHHQPVGFGAPGSAAMQRPVPTPAAHHGGHHGGPHVPPQHPGAAAFPGQRPAMAVGGGGSGMMGMPLDRRPMDQPPMMVMGSGGQQFGMPGQDLSHQDDPQERRREVVFADTVIYSDGATKDLQLREDERLAQRLQDEFNGVPPKHQGRPRPRRQRRRQAARQAAGGGGEVAQPEPSLAQVATILTPDANNMSQYSFAELRDIVNASEDLNLIMAAAAEIERRGGDDGSDVHAGTGSAQPAVPVSTVDSPPWEQHNNRVNVFAADAPGPVLMANGLPEFWEERVAPDGRVYYVNHQTRTTHWELPK